MFLALVILSHFDALERGRVQTPVGKKSRTKQSMKDECDVNQIVARFRKTGLITHLAQGQPRYLDVSEVRGYREALENVRAVGAFFSGLPAPLRAEFNNDPAEFLDFVSDPANAERMAEYGLAEKASSDRPESGDRPGGGDSPAPGAGDGSGKGSGQAGSEDAG